MTTRTTAVGTQSSSDFLTAAEYNDAAGGWIGRVLMTASASSTTSSGHDYSGDGLTVTVTAGTSRLLKIEACVLMSSDVANDDVGISLWEGSTQLQFSQLGIVRANSGYSIHCWTIVAPSSGNHTYFVKGGRQAGTGNVTLQADATYPARLLVSDIGPA